MCSQPNASRGQYPSQRRYRTALVGAGDVRHRSAAGLVFALTMASMVVSEVRLLGQVGTTIGLGLLFDTLVVRSFMTPAIATLAQPVVPVVDERAHASGAPAAGSTVNCRGRRWLSIGMRRYAAVNWALTSKPPGKTPESRQKTPRDAPRDER
jgi:hypothetical protein